MSTTGFGSSQCASVGDLEEPLSGTTNAAVTDVTHRHRHRGTTTLVSTGSSRSSAPRDPYSVPQASEDPMRRSRALVELLNPLVPQRIGSRSVPVTDRLAERASCTFA